MVTCQSPSQLKTPAKVSWAFKMVSQFGSLGCTIMGKTADLTAVQKTIIDTLHKEGKPQILIAKEVGCSQSAASKHVNRKLSGRKKDAQPTERTAALWGLSSKIDLRIWVNFTRNGLRLGSRHQEPPHTDVSRNLASVVIRGVLPGLRIRTGLLPSCPNSSFQMRASFVFNLGPKVLLVWHSTEVVAYISLHALPFFSSLLASAVSSHLIYWRDSFCTALQTRKLWIWSTGVSARLIPSSQREVWVLGNLFVLTGRSRPDIRGMHGRSGETCVWWLFPLRTLRISTFSAPW